ncbi:MAG TPA: hypothetical protein VM659_23410 [Dongiaceae bacterium]|nr:hypothetical protein [Dongiaceae bacterium]
MMPSVSNIVLSLRGQVLPIENDRAVVLRFYFGKKKIEHLALSGPAALSLYRAIRAYVQQGRCDLPGAAYHDVIARRLNELNCHYADIADEELKNIDEDAAVVTELDPISGSSDLLLQSVSRSAEIRSYRLDVFAVHALVAVLELCLVGSLTPLSSAIH